MDYDGDGHLDLFIANYIDLDLKTVPLPESGSCLYKGVLVACWPPGLPGGKNLLYHNNCDGTFTDVSERAGLTHASGTYGLGVRARILITMGGRTFMSATGWCIALSPPKGVSVRVSVDCKFQGILCRLVSLTGESKLLEILGSA